MEANLMINKILFFGCFLIILLCSCSKKEEAFSVSSTVEEENEFLKDRYGFDLFRFMASRVPKENSDISLEYYYTALEFYNKGDIDNTINRLESALSTYVHAVYYYLYGTCLMDTGDYENAEKAFKKFLKFCEYELGNQEDYGWDEPYTTLYTFDNNNNVRERYFSWYNLACIYSIKNDAKQSMGYLTEALEWGYPYIDHIFDDPDLVNLFDSDNSIKEKINDIYSAGFIDTVSKKNFHHQILNDAIAYLFSDSKSVRTLMLTSDDRGVAEHGTYEVKNYQVLIHYNKATGYKGCNGFSLGGNMVFEYYEPYEREIAGFERIAIKNITSENFWKEEQLEVYDYFFKKPERMDDFYELKRKYNIE